jgi:F420-dependent oxidoreductase-like protein
MLIGLQLPSFSFPGWPATIGPMLSEMAGRAEDAGFASLWVMDHLFQLPEDTGLGGPEEPMLEASTTLGFLAHATTRIRLGAMVHGVHFRPPGLLVKAATTLDVLAGGRSYLGLGAGWYEREAIGLGIPFPDRATRFDLLEDTLRLVHRAWTGDRSPFVGRLIDAAEPIVVPSPIARPRPSILIAGGGERRTLRLVARYGDACNILVPDPGESRAKLAVLRRHCEAIGRDMSEIETTSLIEVDLRPGRQSIEQAIAMIRAQAAEGIEHVIVNMPEVYRPAALDAFRHRIIPELADVVADRAPTAPATTATD